MKWKKNNNIFCDNFLVDFFFEVKKILFKNLQVDSKSSYFDLK